MWRFLTFCLSLFCLCSMAVAQPLGQTVPDFEFQTLEGETTKLSQLREAAPKGVVMMTFWCTSCRSCRNTEASLANMARRYGGEAKVVAVASSRYDSAEDVKKYMESNDLEMTILMDPGSQAGRHLGVKRTTTTVLLDQEGKVRYYGTLTRRKKAYAREALTGLLGRNRVSQPAGPILG